MSAPQTLRQTGVLLGACVLTITVVAIALRATGAGAWARGELRFGFAGVPREPGQVVAIWSHNALLVLLCAACALVVQAARWALETDRALAALRTGCDAALLVHAANNLVTVGIAVGAYGNRMVAAMLPHGPVELAAFALAASLYLRARHQPVTPAGFLTVTATALLVLAAAAMSETYLQG